MHDNMRFWDTFAKTGKVDDYIKYKEVQRHMLQTQLWGC